MILKLPQVDLYYEIDGKGPYLFIAQSGEGDANRTWQLVCNLKEHFTVVTYDRRGLSRSTIKDSYDKVTIDAHANDLYELITFLTESPVMVLGCSIGAVIALSAACQYQNCIKTIIAHEPVMPSLLPGQAKSAHLSELREVWKVYNDNWIAGLKQMAKLLGIDPDFQNKEPEVSIEPLTITRKPNFDFFVNFDFDGIIDFEISPETLTYMSRYVQIIPAVGRDTDRKVFDYKCAEVIAKAVRKEIVYFPGGHNGNCTHPKGYAEMLIQLLK